MSPLFLKPFNLVMPVYLIRGRMFMLAILPKFEFFYVSFCTLCSVYVVGETRRDP